MPAAQLAETEAGFRACDKAGLSLTEAVWFAVLHAKPPPGVLSVAEAIELALKEMGKSKRPTYRADRGKRWRHFERWLPADQRKAVNAVTKFDVRKFHNGCNLKLVDERNMLSNLSVLFSWAVKQQHMTKNPSLGIAVEESTVKKSAVRILSIEEARKLLHLAAAASMSRPRTTKKRSGGKNSVQPPSPFPR